jgi:hypothetical protein
MLRSIKYRALKDMEDDGLVKENRSKGRSAEVYGPVHVLAHDFRILYGHGAR